MYQWTPPAVGSTNCPPHHHPEWDQCPNAPACEPEPKPGCGCPPPPPTCNVPQAPCPPPIPPIKYVPGLNTQEQMARTIERVNQCIGQWNAISYNCYEAMRACVGACISNDVYYDADEVHFEDGYSQADKAPYTIVTIKPRDKSGKPIAVKLALAYNNTTNSNVKQSIEEVSLLTNANAIITAVNPTTMGWQGTALYQGMPISSSSLESDFVAGFNKCGQLQIFAGNTDTITLTQNGMVDVIGGVIPIIEDGQVTEAATELTTKSAVTAIGYKSGSGERVFLSAGAQESTGLQGVTVANLLQGMGCTTAVITCIQQNAEGIEETCGMEFLGKLTAAPNGYITPAAVAFWYVSKRPCCGWSNKFTSEIADLVQTTGANQNKLYNLLHGLDVVRDTANAALQLAQSNKQEIDTINTTLDTIEQEITELQTNVADLQTRMTDAESRLNKHDDDIAALQQDLAQETQERKDADTALQTSITAETDRAKAAEAQLQANLNKEQQDRISADNDLNNAIAAEILARSTADTRLEALVSAEEARAKKAESDISATVTGITDGSTPMPYVKLTGDTMTGALVLPGAPTADLEAATKKYVDDAVAAGGGGGGGGDVTKEYVDQQVAALNTAIATKVAKAGDTMTGPLVLSGAPTTDLQAATKKYVDDAVAAGGGGTTDALPLAGGTMTGNITMSSGTYVKLTSPPATGMDAVNKTYLDTQLANADTKYLALTGGVMSGDIGMAGTAKITQSAAPVDGSDLTNKTYVDGAVQALDTELDSQEGRISALEDTVDGITSGTSDMPYVKKTGDTMTGSLNFGMAGSIGGHEGHIDIDSASSTGAVYINRTNNGAVQEGGTGELHTTGIHAPQALTVEPTTQLILQPGTTIQAKTQLAMNYNRITGLLDGIEANDAATVGQIADYKTNATLNITATDGTTQSISVVNYDALTNPSLIIHKTEKVGPFIRLTLGAQTITNIRLIIVNQDYNLFCPMMFLLKQPVSYPNIAYTANAGLTTEKVKYLQLNQNNIVEGSKLYICSSISSMVGTNNQGATLEHFPFNLQIMPN